MCSATQHTLAPKRNYVHIGITPSDWVIIFTSAILDGDWGQRGSRTSEDSHDDVNDDHLGVEDQVRQQTSKQQQYCVHNTERADFRLVSSGGDAVVLRPARSGLASMIFDPYGFWGRQPPEEVL